MTGFSERQKKEQMERFSSFEAYMSTFFPRIVGHVSLISRGTQNPRQSATGGDGEKERIIT